jgi:hypothetical protein
MMVVEAGHGLVEQDDLGLGHERHAEVEELLLAVGQVGGEIVRDVRELQEVEEPQGALSLLGLGTTEEPAEHGHPTLLRGHQQVLQHRHLREELDELKDPGHATPGDLVGGEAGDVLALERHTAQRGPEHARDTVEERSLP